MTNRANSMGWLVLALAVGVSFHLRAHAQHAEAEVKSSAEQTLERFISYWVGSFSNERQALLHQDRLVPEFPELVRLSRDMRVHRLEGSELGDTALFLQEIKSDAPTLAHRQRVMTFEWLKESQEVHVIQHFFAAELTYDRPLMDASAAAALKAKDFTFAPGCDLYFQWEAALNRFKGGMRPQACKYEHPVSGPVYAEFDMILTRHQLLYRDRSMMISDGSIRGEIDGFSWLRFDRLSDEPQLANGDRISKEQLMRRMPASGGMEGTWEGTFTRVDPEGKVLETFPTTIVATFLPDGHEYDFHQLHIYRLGESNEQVIESYGKWNVDRLHFFNDRLEGWSKDLDLDDSGLTYAFTMNFKDGSGISVSEIISQNPNNLDERLRATQYMKDGKLLRRTLIEERRTEQPQRN
ncbi:MAG: CpcT/CpeT family chromophore lyase [Pseudomonadota bacterium]